MNFRNPLDQSFYIFKQSRLFENIRLWKHLFPQVHPYYAMKCNNYKPILKTLGKNGFGFDCASIAEINTIKKHAPCSPIIFANPIKMVSHLNAIKYSTEQVSMMTFDSIEELNKIKYHDKMRIIRLAVDDRYSASRLNTKFGIGLDSIESLFKRATIPITGIAFHVGSNCRSSESYTNALNDTITALDIANRYGHNISTIDIGGGFSNNLSLLNEISVIMKNFSAQYPCLDLIGEPGRLMVENVFDLYVKIIGKSNNKYFINNSIYGDLNCIIFDNKNLTFDCITELHGIITMIDGVWIDSDKNVHGTKKIQLFGATCDSLDVIFKEIDVPEVLSVNDHLKFHNMGAYTYSARSNFNGIACAEVRHK